MSAAQNGVGDRLRAVREALAENLKSMSDRFGLGMNTWALFERENRLPKSETLQQLAALGFSIDWLVTGAGTMRGQPFAHGAVIDAEMMAQIANGLVRLYDEEGQVLAPSEQGRISAQIYNELLLTAEESERRTILRHLLRVRQRDLREARLTTASSKRSG